MIARSPFTPDEIARQLDDTRTGATLPAGPLGDWLLKRRLVRKNPRTGWFDITPAGRRELERLREVCAVEKLVGPAGLRPLPLHVWCRAWIESGRASPELVAAAEHARRYWDAVLPTLPTLGATDAE